MSHHHVETIIAHRRRQLTALAQVRNQPGISRFDSQTIKEMFNREPDSLTDKDFEMIQTLTMRYIERVPA